MERSHFMNISHKIKFCKVFSAVRCAHYSYILYLHWAYVLVFYCCILWTDLIIRKFLIYFCKIIVVIKIINIVSTLRCVGFEAQRAIKTEAYRFKSFPCSTCTVPNNTQYIPLECLTLTNSSYLV